MNGSQIAKSGFDNEHAIVAMFNDFKNNTEAKKILKQMGYNPSRLSPQDVSAVKIPGTVKPDIKVTVLGEENYLSAKKYNPKADFNHVARSSTQSYHKAFNFNNNTLECLKVFTGETIPSSNPSILKDASSTRSHKRAVMTEIKEEYVGSTLKFFKNKSREIIDYIFCGNAIRPNYMIITQLADEGPPKYYLYPMKEVVDFYFGDGEVAVSPRGSLIIGNSITVQRKGGTGSPTNLQFKFRPSLIVGSNLVGHAK